MNLTNKFDFQPDESIHRDDEDHLTNNTVYLHELLVTRLDRWDEIISPNLQFLQNTDLSITTLTLTISPANPISTFNSRLI